MTLHVEVEYGKSLAIFTFTTHTHTNTLLQRHVQFANVILFPLQLPGFIGLIL